MAARLVATKEDRRTGLSVALARPGGFNAEGFDPGTAADRWLCATSRIKSSEVCTVKPE
jgi:hypothetical protein